MANKALKNTPTALDNFGIFLSHNGSVVLRSSLPVVTARSGLLNAGVGLRLNSDNEVELYESSWKKLCKQFCSRRLYDATSILTKRVLEVRVCQSLQMGFV